MTIRVVNADCLEALKGLDDCSVDAVITDPPYGLSNTKPQQVADVLAAWVTGDVEAVPATKVGFMGKDWDSFVPPPAVWEECMRVLKPGGHMAVFAGARTQDLMGLSIRLAGFEIRDTLGWIYGSGFPKSMDISKAIDKGHGHWRGRAGEVISDNSSMSAPNYERTPKGDPITDDAKRWDGWGTALKPAIEPIILARKPLDGTVAGNVLAWGVGGLNIDASRVGTANTQRKNTAEMGYHGGNIADSYGTGSASGRFPANVLLDEHAAAEMDEQSGVRQAGGYPASKGIKSSPGANGTMGGGWAGEYREHRETTLPGGASRFFPVFKYQAKAPKKERPVVEREDGTKIQHPTVKPLALLEWLATLITPPGGTILDPFAGTGTTLQAAAQKGFNSIGIEQSAEYVELINQRLADAGLKGAA